MHQDFSFIKIQPSSGELRNKDGKTVGFVWIFRSDVAMKDRHWFEPCGTNTSPDFLCIEVGDDQIPINCKRVFRNLDEPRECEKATDEEVLRYFEFCCKLLSKKNSEDKIQRLGGEILNDILSNNGE